MASIYIVGRDGSVESLFSERGHEVHSGDIPNHKVDLVVFTGGSDIDPKWYGEENTDSYVTGYSRARDDYEFSVYEWAKELNLPKAGICRGGQLFNIANGGKMLQHIDGQGKKRFGSACMRKRIRFNPDPTRSSHPACMVHRQSQIDKEKYARAK